MDDLKVIKKLYGEAMSHFCRDMFSTILEQKGALLNILVSHFEPSRFLYQDIIEQNKEDEFKSFVYKIFDGGIREVDEKVKTPEELLSDAGYTLYKCETEEDIEKFRKYYASGEEICTFWTNRLKKCYVFFAVKKNADEIKREDFKNPKRQDEYGTSVISIQFDKNETHRLSIKNRYNHTVSNCDATFGNNLDNIIEGLTDSFAVHYKMNQTFIDYFEMDGYVLANDGKYYKYNYEKNNVYYCPDNIIIDNGVVKRYEKERYIILDYFVLDLVNKIIVQYDDRFYESFASTIGKIKNIKIENIPDGKRIIITPIECEDIIIELDKQNRIISYSNSNIDNLRNYFLTNRSYIKHLYLPNVTKIGTHCLVDVRCLEELTLEKVYRIGDNFLMVAPNLKTIKMPKVERIEDFVLSGVDSLEEIELESLQIAGDSFLEYASKLKKIYLPNLIRVGDTFCKYSFSIEGMHAPLLDSGYEHIRNNLMGGFKC